MTSTPIVGISAEIARQLERYNLVLQEDIKEITDLVTKELVKELKTSPRTPRLTSDYAKGWKRTRFKRGWIVHNETDYQLTHLLEKGHAKVGGGRVPAYPHIAPLAEKAIQKFEDKIDEIARVRR